MRCCLRESQGYYRIPFWVCLKGKPGLSPVLSQRRIDRSGNFEKAGFSLLSLHFSPLVSLTSFSQDPFTDVKGVSEVLNVFSPSVTPLPHFFFLNENDIWPGKEERDSFLFVPFPFLQSPENLTASLLLS